MQEAEASPQPSPTATETPEPTRDQPVAPKQAIDPITGFPIVEQQLVKPAEVTSVDTGEVDPKTGFPEVRVVQTKPAEFRSKPVLEQPAQPTTPSTPGKTPADK